MDVILSYFDLKGKRMATKNAEIMIHQPLISGGLSGQATEIKIHADHMVKTREKLNRFLSEKTGQSLEKIETDTERDSCAPGISEEGIQSPLIFSGVFFFSFKCSH